MKIGEVLRDWRLVEKMTLREAAPKLGLSVPTMQRIEQDKPIDGDTMWKLIVTLFGP
jgi:transcriptional regulator with XRE-family HTH domain